MMLRNSSCKLIGRSVFSGGGRCFSQLVSADWLTSEKDQEEILILDCGSSEAVQRSHLPRALTFPLAVNGLKDPMDPNNSKLIQSKHFAQIMSSLGITNDSTLVFYDDELSMKATRAWWVCRHFGHPADKLKILNGGWNKWIAQGNAIASGSPHPVLRHSTYVPSTKEKMFVNLKEVKSMLARSDGCQFLDARSIGEFSQGRIPGAINFEWKLAMDEEKNWEFKSIPVLEEMFMKSGLKKDKPVVTYCYLGIRAAHTAFVLKEILGFSEVFVYEGSMMEYLSRNDTEIEKY